MSYWHSELHHRRSNRYFIEQLTYICVSAGAFPFFTLHLPVMLLPLLVDYCGDRNEATLINKSLRQHVSKWVCLVLLGSLVIAELNTQLPLPWCRPRFHLISGSCCEAQSIFIAVIRNCQDTGWIHVHSWPIWYVSWHDDATMDHLHSRARSHHLASVAFQ